MPFNALVNGIGKEAAEHKQKQRVVRISHNPVMRQHNKS